MLRARTSCANSSPACCSHAQAYGADPITSADLESCLEKFRGRELFGRFRHDRPRHAGQPAIDKLLQPRAFDHVMHGAVGKVKVTRTRAWLVHAIMAARGPAMQHRVGYVGMKLEAE